MNKLLERYRYSTILLGELVKTDFKLRYQNSFLGYLWSLLKPLFLFLILYVVFVRFLRADFGVPYSGLYLLLAVVIWGFFSEVTGTSVSSVVSKGDLMRKLNFPRYVIVLAGTVSATINLFLNLLVVAVFMIVARVDLGANVLWVPLLFAQLVLLGLALAFFLSATFVKLRDISYIWDVVLQALFYLTPILYPISLIPLTAQKILLLNPLAQIIQDLRYILVSPQTTTIADVYHTGWVRLVPVVMTLALAVLTAFFFRSRSKYFAEDV